MLIGLIDGFTRQLGKPPDWPEDKPCQSLAIRDTTSTEGDPVMGSAWIPTPEELERLKAGAHIHLWIWGTGHPPVALTVGEVP